MRFSFDDQYEFDYDLYDFYNGSDKVFIARCVQANRITFVKELMEEAM